MHLIEPLEARIAPSSMISFTDLDGDRVTIRSSLGILTAGMLDLSAPAGPAQLYSLTLTAPEFMNASITFSVSHVAGGDGLVNVGKMNAVGADLFSVSIPGDLGVIRAGDADLATPAIRSLNVLSMGTLGISTQDPSLSPTLDSFITGDARSIQVDNDVRDAKLFVQNGSIGSLSIFGVLDGGRVVADGDIGKLRIQNGIVGRDLDDSGSVLAHGSIGTVTLAGPIIGGEGARSGSIVSDHDLRTLNLDGSLLGGFGTDSGHITAGRLLSFIKMYGDVRGGTGRNSGVIESTDSMRSVAIAGDVVGGAGEISGRVASDIFGPFAPGTVHYLFGKVLGGAGDFSGTFVGSAAHGAIRGYVIGGSGEASGGAGGEYGDYRVTKDVIGGAGDRSGSVGSGNSVNRATIGGSIVGGSGDGSGVVGWAGMNLLIVRGDVRGGSVAGAESIDHTGYITGYDVGRIVIFGSMISGTDSSSGTLDFSGAIDVHSAQSVEIRGDVSGNSTEPVTIRSFGGDAADYGFHKITILGDVRYGNLFAGAGFTVSTPDTKLGIVQVNGDWTASNLAVGSGPGTDGVFGTDDDYNGRADPAIISTIEQVIIRGRVTGTSDPGDHFGIVAEEIQSVAIHGVALALTAGPSNDVVELAPAGTADFSLREL